MPIDELTQERITKLDALKAQGLDPFKLKFKKDKDIACIINANQDKFSHENPADNPKISVESAGRIMAKRKHGKSAFCDLFDSTAKIQLYFGKDTLGDKFEMLDLLDIGDIVSAKGDLFKTRTGELTIRVEGFTILSKSIRALPEKWHGLKDIEIRYRQRYVDLIVNKEVKEVFVARSKMIAKMRQYLDSLGFLEVETPMMQSLPGGATAEPFKTHHNALDIDLFMRIAPELYLKRLVVGGFEKVYEINKNFRNEGISIKHNPEFTMLEVYKAYADYKDMMELVRAMILSIAGEVLNTTKIKIKDVDVDLAEPWQEISLFGILKEKLDIDFNTAENPAQIARQLKIEVENPNDKYHCINKIFEKLIEPQLIKPTFITDYPSQLCPLARKKTDNPEFTERFELFLGGIELANAYTELNDPIEQQKRFFEQNPNAVDEDYVRALEYGMPPAGGLGVGIDRLVMLLLNQPSIRDVILFPQMRPEQ